MAPSITVFKSTQGVTPIKVGRRILVSGLFWEILPTGANYRDEARKLAKRERASSGVTLDVVYIRRHSDIVQAGFVRRGGRARKGTFSLAAVAADALGPTFIAAFELPDGRYALTSASHDAIVPDSEGVFEAEDARRRLGELWTSLSSDAGNGDNLVVYAPTDLWPDGQALALTDLLPKVKRIHRLRQRSSFAGTNVATMVTMGVLLGLIGLGWSGWKLYEAQIARDLAARHAADLERLRSQSGLEAGDLSLMRPWTTQPLLLEFAQVCTREIGALPLTLGGWALLSAQCNASGLKASYARTDGRTVMNFRGAATAWSPSNRIHFSGDGDVGTLERRVSMPAGGDDALASIDERSYALMSHWQARFTPFEIKAVNSTVASGWTGNPSDPQTLRPHWRTMQWSIKGSSINPVVLLEEAPPNGVRLQEITMAFNADGRISWNLKGDLYGE